MVQHLDDIHHLGCYSLVLQDAACFPVDTIKGFFKVYEVGIDCAFRLSCLPVDLPDGKDVGTAGSSFSEANLLFANVYP